MSGTFDPPSDHNEIIRVLQGLIFDFEADYEKINHLKRKRIRSTAEDRALKSMTNTAIEALEILLNSQMLDKSDESILNILGRAREILNQLRK